MSSSSHNLIGGLLAGSLTLCLALAIAFVTFSHDAGAVFGVDTVAVDTDTSGNAARTISSLEPCVSISTGSPTTVDIIVDQVPADRGISGFQFDIQYDSTLVNVTGANLNMLVVQAPGSFVLPLGASPPDSDGLFFASVIDFGPIGIEPSGASEVGPGVLARLTFTAQSGIGTSDLTIANLILPDDGNTPMTIANVFNGQVAVNEDCLGAATPTPTPTPTPEECPDLNGDGKVTGRDVSIVARALFSQPGLKRWNPTADLNDDGFVDLSDLFAVVFSVTDPDCR